MRARIFILPLNQDALEAVRHREYHRLYPVLAVEDYVREFVRHFTAGVR